jgi:hypothetical protein
MLGYVMLFSNQVDYSSIPKTPLDSHHALYGRYYVYKKRRDMKAEIKSCTLIKSKWLVDDFIVRSVIKTQVRDVAAHHFMKTFRSEELTTMEYHALYGRYYVYKKMDTCSTEDIEATPTICERYIDISRKGILLLEEKAVLRSMKLVELDQSKIA